MKPVDFVVQSFRPLRARKLETALIVLALGVGVGTVSTLVLLVRYGLQMQAVSARSLENRELRVQSPGNEAERIFYTQDMAQSPIKELLPPSKPLPKISLASAQKVRGQVDGLGAIYLSQDQPLAASGEKDFATLRKVSAEYVAAAQPRISAGRWWSEEDTRENTDVIVLLESYARSRFTGKSALGQIVEQTLASGQKVKRVVVGVASVAIDDAWAETDPSGVLGFAPFSVAELAKPLAIGEFRFVPSGAPVITRAALLRYAQSQWGLQAQIYSRFDSKLRNNQQTLDQQNIVLVFAALSLTIAALNITNLMLARVRNRTRQIGISYALGGSKSSIFWLHLGEALLMALLGSAVGLLLVNGLLQLSRGQTPPGFAPPSVDWLDALLAVGVACVLALAFGLGPALAARGQTAAASLRR